MTIQTRALLVHFFTATGAIFAMLALLAAADENWAMMFLWLVVAFFVDGIDGPLARTYVFIPAFALFKSGLLPRWAGWIAMIAITFSSAIYFCDSNMKTKDNSFLGFPGCWNMLVIVLFALSPNYWIILGLVTFLAVAMFLPIKFIHPVRTKRWRNLSLPIALAWTFFAGWAAWVEFHPESWAHWGLALTSIYLLFAGLIQQVMPGKYGSGL